MGDFWTVLFQFSPVLRVLRPNARHTKHVRTCSELQKRTAMSTVASVSKVSHYQLDRPAARSIVLQNASTLTATRTMGKLPKFADT